MTLKDLEFRGRRLDNGELITGVLWQRWGNCFVAGQTVDAESLELKVGDEWQPISELEIRKVEKSPQNDWSEMFF